MPVIDAQLHIFARNRPERPWTGAGSPVAEATGEQTVALMDAAGVDAAIIVSPWLNYLADASYAYEVAAAHPGRFAVVAPLALAAEQGLLQERLRVDDLFPEVVLERYRI